MTSIYVSALQGLRERRNIVLASSFPIDLIFILLCSNLKKNKKTTNNNRQCDDSVTDGSVISAEIGTFDWYRSVMRFSSKWQWRREKIVSIYALMETGKNIFYLFEEIFSIFGDFWM